jgi:hypothetical protein
MSIFEDHQDPARDPHVLLDLDYVMTEIIRCDDEFCPDLRDMVTDGVELTIRWKYPEMQEEIEQCASIELHNPKDIHINCQELFIEAFNRSAPIFYNTLKKKRQAISPDPLQNYDGQLYASPFWFEGSGDIWRRIFHGSKRITVSDCEQVRYLAAECLKDPEKSNDFCFRLYGHSMICEAGCHCPYLRFPLLGCLQDSFHADFHKLRACIETIPHFRECNTGYVPQAQHFTDYEKLIHNI